MQFIKTTGWDEGITATLNCLRRELQQHKRVLWLIGGGSNITASVQIMHALPAAETKKLAIFLTDERYGEFGHADSNAKQLYDAGFDPQQAIFVPMLEPDLTLVQTLQRYTEAIQKALSHADSVIAQSGIGPDGHFAGILPQSSAVSATGLVTAYSAPPFTRITLTFEALRHIHTVFAMAFGDNKHHALEQLRDQNLLLPDQPAQILKELPEVFVYNDQIGDIS